MSEPQLCGVCLTDSDHTTDAHLAQIVADLANNTAARQLAQQVYAQHLPLKAALELLASEAKGQAFHDACYHYGEICHSNGVEFLDSGMMTPEQQLRSLATRLQHYTQVEQLGGWSANQRPDSRPHLTQYAADHDTIVGAARQLADMVMAYLDGTFAAMPGNGEPF